MSVTLHNPIALDDLLRIEDLDFKIHGRCEQMIKSISSLSEIKPGTLCFCKSLNEKNIATLLNVEGAVIIADRYDVRLQHHCIVSTQNPFLLFAYVLRNLFGSRPDSTISPNQWYGRPIIAETAVIHAGATVMAGCKIGEGSVIMPGAVLYSGTQIGRNVTVEANAVIGNRGLAVAEDASGEWFEVPHVGDVVIDDNVSIGANSVVVRGLIDSTYIGRGTKIANLVNIGHNCHIGDHCWISSGVQLAGSTRVEDGAMLGLASMAKNHVNIGAKSQLGIGAVVVKSVASASTVFGNPAKSLKTMKDWRSS